MPERKSFHYFAAIVLIFEADKPKPASSFTKFALQKTKILIKYIL